MAIVQEFDADGRHRLVGTETGEQTYWATYQRPTYLNGMVGHTAYYGTKEAVVTPDEFCQEFATGKAPD